MGMRGGFRSGTLPRSSLKGTDVAWDLYMVDEVVWGVADVTNLVRLPSSILGLDWLWH
jgi:hypothetical protein